MEVINTGDRKSINTAAVKELQRLDSFTSEIVSALVVSIPRHLHNEPECIKAKERELRNWEQFEVFEEVEDNGQFLINTNWVLVRKESGIKARLCIRGDQEPEKDSIRTDAPTVNKVNLKLFYVLAVHFGWQIKTADIQAAFLQGTLLDREVFVRPPKERRVRGIVWKMRKRAYGFVDASCGFYLELRKVLEELGCKVSIYDPALFMYSSSNELQGLLLAHVDDLIHGAGTEEFYNVILCPLKERFTFGKEEEQDFNYVGHHVKQVGPNIIIDQDAYVADVEVPDTVLNDLKPDKLLDEEGQSDFRAVVG